MQWRRGAALATALALVLTSLPLPQAWALRAPATDEAPVVRRQLAKTLLLFNRAAPPTPAEVAALTDAARQALAEGHALREDTLTAQETPWLTLALRVGDKDWADERPLLNLIAMRYHARHAHQLPEAVYHALKVRLQTLLDSLIQEQALLGSRRIALLLHLDDPLKPISLAEHNQLILFAKGGQAHPDLDRPETINLTLTAAYVPPAELRHILQHELDNLQAGRYVHNATTQLAQAAARAATTAHQQIYDRLRSTIPDDAVLAMAMGLGDGVGDGQRAQRPLLANAIDLERARQWVTTQPTPALRALAQWLLDHIQHVTQVQFEQALRESVTRFNATMQEPYVVLNYGTGRSTEWTLRLAKEHGLRPPLKVIDGSVDMRYWLLAHPAVSHVVIVDDASYSFQQITQQMMQIFGYKVDEEVPFLLRPSFGYSDALIRELAPRIRGAPR